MRPEPLLGRHLSIWPYISASIILQLMTAVIPALERLAREGESGRQKLNQYTRYFTIFICLFQGFFIARMLENPAFLGMGDLSLVASPGWGFRLLTIISMTAASMLVMWLGDQITARGIGNGISLIIMINICSRLPVAIIEAYDRYFAPHAMHSLFERHCCWSSASWSRFTLSCLRRARKVPIHTARRTVGAQPWRPDLPLRVNFPASCPSSSPSRCCSTPAHCCHASTSRSTRARLVQWFGAQLIDSTSAIYLVSFTLLVFFFCFFWVATQFNAMRIADDLKRTGSYVPGIRPGRATAEYLDHTMTRVTLIGAIGLIFIAIFPQLLRGFLNIPDSIAGFFGGTSLLIIVGVALDTLRQMESMLVMRHYDGFLKHGRMRGRR